MDEEAHPQTRIPVMRCPECHASYHDFITDYRTGEVSCGCCGLVLRGVPQFGVVYPDLLVEWVDVFLVDLQCF